MTETTPAAPPKSPAVAAKQPHSFTHHGVTIDDPYHWLRDPGYPEVTDPAILGHLQAENAWFEARMKPCEPLIETLVSEMRGRIKEADKSVPQRDGDWLYWIEYEEGAEYKKWWRRPVSGGSDELILDEVALAEGLEYFRLGAISVSNNGRMLAWSVDDSGSERFTVRIKVIASGEVLPDVIPETDSSLIWAAGDTALVYSHLNAQWRTDNARLHWLGKPVSEDIELFHEDDEGFRVSAGLSANDEWLVISSGDHETSEIHLIPAAAPLTPPLLVRARQVGVEYDVDLHGETLFIHTNDTHENFRLATAPLSCPDAWTTLIEGSEDFYLTGFDLFRDFYVTEGRVRGLDRIEVRYYDDPARIEPIAFPEASYEASLGDNPEWAMQTLRVSYESMVSPASVYDYHIADRRLERLKTQEIPSGYNAARYATERLEIAARDGTLVPVSVVYRRDRTAGGPLYLYGYGAYGIAIGPGFSTARMSLLDRGMAFAIAHIRGGDDLGRAWYKAGKLESRTNTFNDFVDVAEGLIACGLTAAGRIAIAGGSAGGELIGAVIHSNAELFGAYSPYDQVKPQAYPPLLVTAGLNDPRVTYWEPAKWVAKLRELKTDNNELMFKTNMGAGHGGKSGRFEGLRETAEEFAFILWQLGLSG